MPKPFHALVYSATAPNGYRHASIPDAVQMIKDFCTSYGCTVTEDATGNLLTAAELGKSQY